MDGTGTQRVSTGGRSGRLPRRRFLGGTVAAGAAVALGGAWPVRAAPAPHGAPAWQPGTITLQWQTANLTEAQYEPVWKELVAAFERDNPNIKIEPILVARRDHWTKFVTAAKANQAPDVVSVDIATAAYNGYLRPLDDYWNAEPTAYREAWPASSIRSASWQGKLYGLPSWGGIHAEFYNRELVSRADLDMGQPPATWDDFLTWNQRLTRREQDQYGLAILGGKTDTTTRLLLTWIWSNGGEAFNQDLTEATFARDPRALEAIEFYLNLDLVHGVAAPGAVNTNYLEQTELFAQEKIGTMRSAYWAFAKVVGDNPSIKEKIAVAPLPLGKGSPVTMTTVTCDSISKDSRNPDAAWRFIKHINEREWGIKRAQVSNWLPIRTDLVNDPEVQRDPLLLWFLEYGKVGRAYPIPHPIWADIAANDIVNAVQAALLRQGSVREVFERLDRDLTRKLNDV